MKLSKAQQEVVDKMRKGWILYAALQTGMTWLKQKPRSKETTPVDWFNFKHMLSEGIIEPTTKFTIPNRYQLTEKYRMTEQKQSHAYIDRVRAIATEMARDHNEKLGPDIKGLQLLPEHFLDTAASH